MRRVEGGGARERRREKGRKKRRRRREKNTKKKKETLSRKTDIIKDCRVRIIELQDHLLSTYDRAISEYTDRQFERAGIELVLNSKVLEVCGNGTGKGFVRVKGVSLVLVFFDEVRGVPTRREASSERGEERKKTTSKNSPEKKNPSSLSLSLSFQQPDGKETSIDYGACVWSTGVAIHPLVKQLQGKLAAGSQTHFRSVVTTPWLEVRGMIFFPFFFLP